MRQFRVYVDTSVIGGVFDDKFGEASALFFAQAKSGRFETVISGLVVAEIENSPPVVRSLFDEILDVCEVAELTAFGEELANSYVKSGVVGAKRFFDALHVATATLSGCRALVSWNYRHLVHIEKEPLYNAVNKIHGYNEIAICTPSELIEYGS